jgi:pilus assembly protein CpaC
LKRPASHLVKRRGRVDLAGGFVRSALVLISVLLSLTCALPAAADPLEPEASATSSLHVAAGKSAPLKISGTISRIVVSQPEIATVDTAGPNDLYVMGHDVGATNLLVFGPDGSLTQVINVEVGYDGVQLQDDINALLPGEPIRVQSLSGGVLLRGSASDAKAAALASDLAQRAAGGDVVSLVDVRPDQILLEFQIVEASEDDLRDIGVDLGAMGSGFAMRTGSTPGPTAAPQGVVTLNGNSGSIELDAALRVLERRGSARILARPQLLALSGEAASFRSGGEFPYPVPTRDGVTIEFKPYGTAISVRPTMQTNGLIRLDLAAEVSDIDPRNSVTIEGLTIPALNTRRAITHLNLRDGETFMFAGLFSDSELTQQRGTPWSADLPVVGSLFKAVHTRNQRMQLAIFVTARVIGAPDAADVAPQSPDELALREPASDVAAAAPSEPKPRGLKKLLRSSPLAEGASRRLTSLFHATVEVPGKVWARLEGWSRHILKAFRSGPSRSQATLKSAAPKADS